MAEAVTAPEPTQVEYPGRAVLRTILQAAVGLILLVPFVVAELGPAAVPWLVAAAGAAGIMARIMAIPQVNAWLTRWVGPLGASKV